MPCHPIRCICGNYTFPMRYVVASVLFTAMIYCSLTRSCLSITITTMAKSDRDNDSKTSYGYRCPYSDIPGEVRTDEGYQGSDLYDWSHLEREVILGSFFLGYFIAQIPGGILVDKNGARYVLGTCVLVSIILTGLTPFITKLGWIVFSLFRVILGIFQAPLVPSLTCLIGKWFPRRERSFMTSFIISGGLFGHILGEVGTATMTKNHGWEMSYYVWSAVGAFYFIFYIIWVYSYPTTSPFISPAELEFLNEVFEHKAGKKPSCPWKKVFKDRCLYALIMGQLGFDYTNYGLMSNLPTYLDKVSHLDIETIGLLSSLPFLGMFLTSVMAGWISDKIIASKKISVLNVRRINHTISSVFPSVFLVITGYFACNAKATAVFLVLCLLTKGPFFAGMKVNILDITKHFVASVSSISNGLSALSGLLSTIVVGYLAEDNTIAQWRGVFWMAFGVSTVTNILYVVLAKANRANWDYLEGEEKPETEEMADRKSVV